MTYIGVDLGTTNSAAAHVEGEEAEIVEIDTERTMRSVATFAERAAGNQEEVIVGESAVDYLETDPDMTVSAVKRHMGDDESYDFEGEDLTYKPEMISGLVLKKIRQEVEDELTGIDDIDDAIITVPARFSEAARSCTEAAAHYGYIDNVPFLLPEPSAACVAYKVDDDSEDIERVAVYDLGGGTFDLSIVNIVPDSEGPTNYVVERNEGKQQLGGEDFDEALQEWLIEQFEADTGIDVDGLDNAYQVKMRVKAAAKEVKEKLSTAETETANIPFLAEGETLKVEVTREKLEELTGHLVDETIELCDDVFDETGYPPSEVDTVLRVGGSTKMPQVQEAIEDYFGQEPVGGVNPDLAVALGAGEQAHSIEMAPAAPTTADEDDGGDAGGELPTGGDVVTPVAPADVGFELADGSLEVIIEKGMNLPAEVEQDGYVPEEDYASKVALRVFRGPEDGETDEAVAANNEEIKTFMLEDIPEAPADDLNIAVRMEMDKSGIVRAEAWDKESSGERAEIETKAVEGASGGGGGGDGDGSYTPPTFEEIQKRRDDLPPVK